MISKKRIGDHKQLYERSGIPSDFQDKIVYIPNAIGLPDHTVDKDGRSFTVLYVGRATEEKRVPLVSTIAKSLHNKGENIQFEIVGDTAGTIRENDYPFIKFHGNIDNEKLLDNIYSKAHVLILTSSTEGFPMVIMEAMAHGCIILSTPVGDIPYHVKQNENGFLFSNVDNGSLIVDEATHKILWLKDNRNEQQRIAMNNINYARHNFGIARFNKDYQDLFSSVK